MMQIQPAKWSEAKSRTPRGGKSGQIGAGGGNHPRRIDYIWPRIRAAPREHAPGGQDGLVNRDIPDACIRAAPAAHHCGIFDSQCRNFLLECIEGTPCFKAGVVSFVVRSGARSPKYLCAERCDAGGRPAQKIPATYVPDMLLHRSSTPFS